MLVFICGQGGSGKDTLAKMLLDKHKEYVKLVTYTTRPMRARETEGVEYHFIDEDSFVHRSYQNGWLEARVYDTVGGLWRYGTPVYKDFDKTYLCWGSYEQYRTIKVRCKDKVVGVFLKSSPNVRLHRMINRIDCNLPYFEFDRQIVEACRRVYRDAEDFKDVHTSDFDLVVDNDVDKLEDVFERLDKGIRGLS